MEYQDLLEMKYGVKAMHVIHCIVGIINKRCNNYIFVNEFFYDYEHGNIIHPSNYWRWEITFVEWIRFKLVQSVFIKDNLKN